LAKSSKPDNEKLSNVPARNYKDLPKLEAPAGYVYVIQDVDFSNRYKIGRTNHPRTRLNKFGVELPFKTEVVHILRTENAVATESDLHKRFAKSHARGEWFDLDDAQLQEIRRLGQPKRQHRPGTVANRTGNPIAALVISGLVFLIIFAFYMIADSNAKNRATSQADLVVSIIVDGIAKNSVTSHANLIKTVRPTVRPPSTHQPTATKPPSTATGLPTSTNQSTATEAAGETLVVMTRDDKIARVRACASTNCEIVGRLGFGDQVKLTGRVDGENISGNAVWVEFIFEGEAAYIHSSLLTITK